MFELAYPWALLCLPLPLLVLYLLPPKRNRVAALRIPFFEQVVQAAGATAGEGSVVLRRSRWQPGWAGWHGWPVGLAGATYNIL